MRGERATRREFFGVTGSLVAVMWLLIAGWSYDERGELLARSGEYSYQTCFSVAENLRSMLDLTRVTLEAANRQALPLRDDDDDLIVRHLTPLARELREKTDQVVDLVTWGRDGSRELVLAAGGPRDLGVGGGTKVFDAGGEPSGPLVIGRPFQSAEMGEWYIPVRLTASGAGIGGVINLRRLVWLHERQRVRDGGTIGVVSGDGILLSRTPYAEGLFGRDSFADLDDHDRWLRADTQTYIESGRRSGLGAKLGSYIRIPEYSLFVFVATNVDRLLEPWRSRFTMVTIVAGVLSVIAFAFAAYMTRSLARYREAHRRFVDVTAIASDMAWETDAELRFRYVSVPDGGILGRTAKEVIGRRASEIGWRPVAPEARAMFDAALSDRRPFTDIQFAREEEGEGSRTALVSGRPYYRHGRFAGFRGVLVDVTERMREAESRERDEERKSQAAKMEALGQLAGGISHDFNNLLGAIIGFGQFLVQDTAEATPQRRYAERILAAGRRGRGLIQRILAFSRRAGGTPEELPMAAVVRETVELLGVAIPSSTSLVVEMGADDDFVIRADRGLIGEAILNLAVNGCDALDDHVGEVRIDVTRFDADHPTFTRLAWAEEGEALDWRDDDGLHWVSLGRPTGERHVVIRVSDTGVGISPDDMRHLFELFFSTKSDRGGTGMGLAMVERAVTEAGGTLVVRSAVGRGAVFEMILPIVDGTDDDAPIVDGEAEVSDPISVLLVDGAAFSRRAIEAALRRSGVLAFAVAEPGEALAAIGDDPAGWDMVVVRPGQRGVGAMAFMEEVARRAPGVARVVWAADGPMAARAATEEGGVSFVGAMDQLRVLIVRRAPLPTS